MRPSKSGKSEGGIAAGRIAALRRREADRFAADRPISRERIGAGIHGFFGGVPMHWMLD